MKGKFRRILSVILCLTMVFTAFSTAFADGEQEEAENVWCTIRPNPGTFAVVISKGNSHGLYVAYNRGSHEDVSLEWSCEGDSCTLELGEPEEESGLIRSATVTSVKRGDFDVTVKLVASDGTVLAEDTYTVISRATDFGMKYEYFKYESKVLFSVTVVVPALGIPMGIIAGAMEVFGADDETIERFVGNYAEWATKVVHSMY